MAEPVVEIRTNLQAVLRDLKDVPPLIARDIRRELRTVGDAVIREQGRILDTENPGTVTGTSYKSAGRRERGGYTRGPLARQIGGARLASVTAADATGKSRKATRKKIKAGLKTRITNSKTRGVSVRIATTARFPSGRNPSKSFNMRKFRHPVFGDQDTWAEQKGIGYFSRGGRSGTRDVQRRLVEVVDKAIETIRTNPPVK